MAKIFGQLESAQFENKAGDYSGTVLGRHWWNTLTNLPRIADGTAPRTFLLDNSTIAVGTGAATFLVGTNGTAASNVRLHRGAIANLQFVLGNDATAEGTLSTSIAQISFRAENYTTVLRPVFGNAGRFIWNTTTGSLQADTGAAWIDATIGTNTVIDSNLRQGAAASLIGRSANSTGNVADIASANDFEVLQRISGALVFGAYKGNVRSVVSTDACTVNDSNLILSGASFVETLPTAVGCLGKELTFIHNGTSLTQVYTFATTGGQTIGGIASGSFAMYTNGEVLRIASNNVNWTIIGRKTVTAETNAGALFVSATSAYTFTIPSSSINAGTIYTNNGQTFTVTTTTSSSTTLTCSGTGTPAASGTLTFVSGSPSGNLAFSARTVTGVPSKSGIVSDKFLWARDGQDCKYRWDLMCGAGGAGTADYVTYLPSNLLIDTTNTQFNSTILGAGVPASGSSIGIGHFISSINVMASAIAYSTAQFRLFLPGSGIWSSGVAGNLGAAQNISIIGRYPVPGWQP